VRTYFLGDDGLVKLEPGLETHILGQSHDRPKICCYNYLLSDPYSRIDILAELRKADSNEGMAHRSQVITSLAFLQYSLESIFNHTNVAHDLGLTQREFIGSSPLGL
jgi:hypothetical protein